MDEFSKEEMEQLLAVFRDQTLHILDEMCEDLLAVESGLADADALLRLRRAAHTIKGDSACIGLAGVTEIAHRMEDVFDRFVLRGSKCEARIFNSILGGLDLIKDAIGGDDTKDVDLRAVGEWYSQFGETDGDEGEEAPGISQALEIASDEAAAPVNTPKRRLEYVRVEARKVDALLNLAGEMVIARSAIDQAGEEFEREFPKSDLLERFSYANAQIGKLVGELQKSVLQMRMVTIDQVFKRFVRPVRELAAECGKRVELEISGGETELDRVLVDLLHEPILHLLRNAVDHGLESNEERGEAGKPEICRIGMRAYHQGNQVVIEVTDDGRGIDVSRLKKKALQVEALPAEELERISDEEALDLIFIPGCSTSEEVTRVSGRGIGAAAVRDAIEQVRGSVSVRSERGIGTVFTLRLPLTLAIIKAMLFTANGQLYAFPLLAVSEIVKVNATEVITLDGLESYRLRDRFISVVRPAVVLGVDRRAGGTGARLRGEVKEFYLIMLRAGGKRYGVTADTVLGEQELVIKPLESQWLQNEALAGASVLGDGQVVLIMDAEMIFRKAIKFERSKGYGRGAYAI